MGLKHYTVIRKVATNGAMGGQIIHIPVYANNMPEAGRVADGVVYAAAFVEGVYPDQHHPHPPEDWERNLAKDCLIAVETPERKIRRVLRELRQDLVGVTSQRAIAEFVDSKLKVLSGILTTAQMTKLAKEMSGHGRR